MKPPLIGKIDRKHRDLFGPLLVNAELLVVRSRHEYTLALERDSLLPRWRAKGMPEALFPSVAVARKPDGPIGYAVADGREIWRLPEQVHVVDSWNGHLLTREDDRWQLRSPDDGQIVLERALPWRAAQIGCLEGDVLMVAAQPGLGGERSLRLSAIDLRANTVLWERADLPMPDDVGSDYVHFFGGRLPDGAFYYTFRGFLYCVGTADGGIRWQKPYPEASVSTGGQTSWIAAGDRLLKWTEDHLIGYDVASGDAVFDLVDETLFNLRYPALALVHDQCAVIVFGGLFAVIDLISGSLVNTYRLLGLSSEAAMVDGRLIVLTSLDLRVFDESIWTLPRPRRASPEPRAPVRRPFKSKRVCAEVLGGDADEPLVFETLPPIRVPGVAKFGAPAVANGLLLVVSESSRDLYAFDSSRFQPQWHVLNSEQSAMYAPITHEGFILSHQLGELLARRVVDGRQAWRTPCDDDYGLSGDFVVTACDQPPRLRLFNPGTQEVMLEFDRPLTRLRGVSEKVAILSHGAPGTDELHPHANPFAAIDLRTGRELWRRDLGPPEEAPKVRSIQDGVIVIDIDGGQQGISVHTGDAIWQSPSRLWFKAGRYWWHSSYEDRRFEVLDVATGEMSIVGVARGEGAGAHLIATYEDYVVSFATKGVYFFHRSRPHQRLPMATTVGGCMGIQIGSDLVLREYGKLRPIRRVRRS